MNAAERMPGTMPRRESPVIKIGPRVYQPTILRVAFIRFDEANNLINVAMRGNGAKRRNRISSTAQRRSGCSVKLMAGYSHKSAESL